MPTPAGFIQCWKNHSHEVVVTIPVEGEAFPLAGILPIQFMGTSNYEFYGPLLPQMFTWCAKAVRRDDGALLENQSVARGPALDYRELHARRGHPAPQIWKYQAWLNGFNGGPLRQPTMKIRDVHMRQLREASSARGVAVTEDPDSAFFVGRNPC